MPGVDKQQYNINPLLPPMVGEKPPMSEATYTNKSEKQSKGIKKRKRRNSLPDISKNIANVLRLIEAQNLNYIEGRHGNGRSGKKNIKGRSSNFIGVSKNGLHWQVLINYGKSKKYIGTYSSEKEAAIAYDFYSILLNTYKAKTNFSYSPELVKEMIYSYDKGKYIKYN